jgi:hypothetical protein
MSARTARHELSSTADELSFSVNELLSSAHELPGPPAADVPEYWVVRVKERAVEVLREPDPIARTYRSRVTMSEAATLTPKAFAGPTISPSRSSADEPRDGSERCCRRMADAARPE